MLTNYNEDVKFVFLVGIIVSYVHRMIVILYLTQWSTGMLFECFNFPAHNDYHK